MADINEQADKAIEEQNKVAQHHLESLEKITNSFSDKADLIIANTMDELKKENERDNDNQGNDPSFTDDEMENDYRDKIIERLEQSILEASAHLETSRMQLSQSLENHPQEQELALASFDESSQELIDKIASTDAFRQDLADINALALSENIAELSKEDVDDIQQKFESFDYTKNFDKVLTDYKSMDKTKMSKTVQFVFKKPLGDFQKFGSDIEKVIDTLKEYSKQDKTSVANSNRTYSGEVVEINDKAIVQKTASGQFVVHNKDNVTNANELKVGESFKAQYNKKGETTFEKSASMDKSVEKQTQKVKDNTSLTLSH